MTNWDDLRAFIAVADETSFALAAKRLGVNKSTVSRRMSALEEALGVRLLDIHGRGHVLTADGQRLLEHARSIATQIEALERDLVGRDAQLSGAVTLATTEALAREVLPPHLKTFRDAFPEVSVAVLTGNEVVRLGEGRAAVALRHGEKPSEGDVVVRALCGVAGALYASREYIEREGRPSRVDLSSHKFVGVHENLAHLPAARFLEELVPSSCIAIRCTDLGSQVAAVEVGLGIAVLPCFAGDARPSLVRLFEPEASLSSELWLVWHGELRRTGRVRALVEHLATALAAERARFEGENAMPPS
jgi:DNA-binding transcriptional LysR family regulator